MEDVHVIEDDDFFSLVASPPLVKRFKVGSRESTVGRTGLPGPRETVDPDTTGGLELRRPDHVVFGDLFNGIVMPEPEFGINGIEHSWDKITQLPLRAASQALS